MEILEEINRIGKRIQRIVGDAAYKKHLPRRWMKLGINLSVVQNQRLPGVLCQ
jgi:hypothetical protein